MPRLFNQSPYLGANCTQLPQPGLILALQTSLWAEVVFIVFLSGCEVGEPPPPAVAAVTRGHCSVINLLSVGLLQGRFV